MLIPIKNCFTLNVNGRFDALINPVVGAMRGCYRFGLSRGMANLKNILGKNAKWLTEARLRLSYGHQGNMVDGQTPNLLIRQGTMQPIYDGENISTVANLPNPNLKWEQTAQTNIGWDLGFLMAG